ncbi:bifunctional polynucleotide [Echinococcus multilocularis]|uniref:Bifunctional polynucleotide n=1 Tax=Echinococcus multilocularis TaxID=6211 RepID=A0A087W090_ECHMU|nr:bifunctional polynucleotide [Echinococcus multilocularis]
MGVCEYIYDRHTAIPTPPPPPLRPPPLSALLYVCQSISSFIPPKNYQVYGLSFSTSFVLARFQKVDPIMPKRKNTYNQEVGDTKKLKRTTLLSESAPAISDNWTQGISLLIYKDRKAKVSSKVLGLDLDGTVITPASGRVFPVDANDWKLISPQIPDILKRFADEGYAIVIMSNQGGLEKMQDKKIPEFKTRVEAVLSKIGVPMRAYFAISTDVNRKPRIGMWQALEADNDGIEIDRKVSIYCGDAAGRVAKGKIKQDHSHCDRLFAENLGVLFKTPEELWKEGERVDSTYPLLFNPKEFQDIAFSTSSPVPPPLKDFPSKGAVLILMIGYPASGKSTFCNNHLTQLGYVIISRDVLKDMKKCVARCEQLLKAGSSVVVDNINVTAASREPFLKITKSLGVPAFACVMQTSLDHCRHNEMFRQLTDKNHIKISSIVFNQMKKHYQTPSKNEGFEEIFDVPFVPDLPFDAQRSLYFQYLLEK